MAQQATLEGFNAKAGRVGMTGAVRTAKVGTQPVPLGTKYDTDKHTNVGYTSPDGLEVSFDEERQEYIPWQEAVAIRNDVTKAVKSVKFTLWQSTIENMARFLGVKTADIVSDAAGNYSFYEGALPTFPHEWLSLDVVDGDMAMRLTLLDAQISARGALIFRKDQMFGLELTYATFPAGDEYAQVESAAVGKTAHWQFNSNWANGGAVSSTTDGVAPLQITAAPDLGTVVVGVAAEDEITVSGGTAPFLYTVTGQLPDGLTINGSTGELAGEPTTAGTFVFVVKVTDSKGLIASRQFQIAVTSA